MTLIRFLSFSAISLFLFLLLSALSCSEPSLPNKTFVIDKNGEITEDSGGNVADKGDKEDEKEEFGVIVNDFFTMDKKKKERVYTFKPNAWFCAKKDVTNEDIEKHTASFPIDLKLDGDKYFSVVILDINNISATFFPKSMSISSIRGDIASTTSSRVFSPTTLTWLGFDPALFNQSKLLKSAIRKSEVSYVKDALQIVQHPVLAFLSIDGSPGGFRNSASNPGVIFHFYGSHKDYQFVVGNISRTVNNPYASVFIETWPGYLYRNGALSSNGAEVLYSLNLYLEDYSFIAEGKPNDELLSRYMGSTLDEVPSGFKNKVQQRGGHEYPLTVKLIFPKHHGNVKGSPCS